MFEGTGATLMLLGPGEPDPQDPDGRSVFPEAIRLSIDGPLNTTHTLVAGIADRAASLESAIRAADPEAIYAIDREYAPFWCPACAASYCKACLVIWIEDDQGFYDCTRGRCPHGHERILDD